MNKAQKLAEDLIVPVVKDAVKSLRELEKSVGVNKLELAEAYHVVNQSIDWRLTVYKSFSVFIKKELEYSSATVYSYLYAYRESIRLGYTKTEMRKIVSSVGWSNFKSYLPILKEKIPVKVLVAEHKKTQMIGSVDTDNNPAVVMLPTLRRKVSFTLSQEYLDKLDTLLTPYGYHETTSRGNNASRSFMRYLDSKFI